MYRCQYCNHQGNLETDFEEDFHHHRGFWCPVCDNFTFFPGKEDYSTYAVVVEKAAENNARIKRTNLKKRLSPLRYPGGKSKMIDMLLPYMDINQHIEQFVEPFCGGASLGLSFLDGGYTDRLILNDKDINVYSFWKAVCGNDVEGLIDAIRCYRPNRQDYFRFRQDLEKELSETERAFKYYVLNRCSFSGITTANPMKDIAARWNPIAAEKRIRKIHSYTEKITILNEDAFSIIEEYYWGSCTVLFIDPPYFKKGHLLYPEKFQKHEELADLINQLVREAPGCANILITYDDDDFIKELYENFQHNQLFFLNRKYSIKY